MVAVVVVLLLGIWVTGGLISDDFTLSMALTAVWMGAAGLACLAIGLRRRDLRVPVLGAYLVTALVVGVYLTQSTFLDDEVDEDVVTAAPAARQPEAEQDEARSARRERAPSGNVQLARGEFESLAHPGEGVATAIRLAKGGQVLTLTNFEVDNGPDLRVYLVAGEVDQGSVGDFKDLGALKGNKGNQQYEIPDGVDLAKYSNVVIWCRAFSVAFASAPLQRS